MTKKKQAGDEFRSSRGEGSIFQRENDGRWVARIPLGGGKRKEGYYDTKKEAEQAKRRMLNDRDKGSLVTSRDQSLKDYLIYWLEVQRMTVKPTTYATQYRYTMTHIIPSLGHIRMQKLTGEMFQSLYVKLQKDGKASNTIRLIHGILRKSLGDAVKLKKLAFNPVEGVRLPKRRKTDVQILSNEQAQDFLRCAKETRLYCLFLMALLLGLRRGELLGLKWRDVDWQKATLRIQRTLSDIIEPETGRLILVEGEPKTETSRRLLHLPQVIMDALYRHREQQLETQASSASWQDRDLIFCNRYGGYIMPRNLLSFFGKVLSAGSKDLLCNGS
jgi:integrase